MRKRALLLFSLVALAALVLTACGGVIDDQGTQSVVQDSSDNSGNTPAQPDQGAPPEPPPADAEGQSDLPADAGEGQAVQSDQETQADQSADLPSKPELGFDLGASMLVASDPNQVNLASGELQLVELFAFW